MKKYYFIKSTVRFESSFSSSINKEIKFINQEVIECLEWHGGSYDELKDVVNHFINKFSKKIRIKNLIGLDNHLLQLIVTIDHYGSARIGSINDGVYDYDGLANNIAIDNSYYENIGMFMFSKDPTNFKDSSYESFNTFITKYERLNKLKIIE